MSVEERHSLEDFFHCLFAEHELGYTLLGDKPISFCFLPTNLPHIATRDVLFKIYVRGEHSYKRGVEIWEKMEHCSSNFSLIIHKEKGFPIFALLVNKKALSEVFEKNIDIFRKSYYRNITFKSLLEDLLNPSILFNKILKEHLSLGILLGYGKRNSELFQRLSELQFPNFKIPFLLNKKFSPVYSSLEEEVYFLKQHLQPITSFRKSMLRVCPVSFAADHTSMETKRLKRKYQTLHVELTEIFKKSDWLEVLLEAIGYT